MSSRLVLLVTAGGHVAAEAIVPYGALSVIAHEGGEERQFFLTGRTNGQGLDVFEEPEAPKYKAEVLWVCRPRTSPGGHWQPGCAEPDDKKRNLGAGTKCSRCGCEGSVFDFLAVQERA